MSQLIVLSPWRSAALCLVGKYQGRGIERLLGKCLTPFFLARPTYHEWHQGIMPGTGRWPMASVDGR